MPRRRDGEQTASERADYEWNRNRYNLREYGITWEQRCALFEAQGGQCAVCGRAIVDDGGAHLDHNHATGELRGFLCAPCNWGLGQFQDDPRVLRAAARYLEHYDDAA